MSTVDQADSLGPLRHGQTVAIIGGGPGGMSAALTLQAESQRRGLDLRVVVFEGKRFGEHYNQCAGVLSPPLTELLAEYHGLTLPEDIVDRRINGYVLHANRNQLTLSGAEHGGPSLAVRRVHFDEFLEGAARDRGVEVIHARVTGLEFRREEVVLFTWSRTFRAAAVVGAFGLSRAMTGTLAGVTPYRSPRSLQTLVVNFRPNGTAPDRLPELLDDHIHVLLPDLPRVEFGALIPKANHVTIILAGERVQTDDMNAFLDLPPVRRLIPKRPEPEDYFKGSFPVSLARAPYGDRYVTVGDAAGLVRPFKGKGVNSALISGHLAARTMLDHGVSRRALRHFYAQCEEITGDLWYGRLFRRLARLAARDRFMEALVAEAERDASLREVLFASLSGHETYKRIVLRKDNLRLGRRLSWLYLASLLPTRSSN